MGERRIRHCDSCKQEPADVFGPELKLIGVEIKLEVSTEPVWGGLWRKMELCENCLHMMARIEESARAIIAEYEYIKPIEVPFPKAQVVTRTRKKRPRRGR